MTTPELPEIVAFELLLTNQAPKLGKRSCGLIMYRLLTDLTRKEIYVQLVQQPTGGNHSEELVPLSRIKAVLDAQGTEPFSAKKLMPCFLGKSSNNSGYLLCALYAEGLAGPSDKAFQHVVLDKAWIDWDKNLLEQQGEPIEIPSRLATAALPADSALPVVKNRRPGKPKNRGDDHAETAFAE